MSDFYDGTKLLSMKDIDNEVPEIFMCTSNRSAGKTTYFNRLCVNGFKKRGEKFCLVYRFNYELACVIGKRVPRIYYKDGKQCYAKDYFNDYTFERI